MFRFVSRKEFEELQERNTVNETLIGTLTTEFMKTAQRISKLEAANNCRDGKHEWETAYQQVSNGEKWLNTPDGLKLFELTKDDISKPYARCKHCDAKPIVEQSAKRKKGKK